MNVYLATIAAVAGFLLGAVVTAAIHNGRLSSYWRRRWGNTNMRNGDQQVGIVGVLLIALGLILGDVDDTAQWVAGAGIGMVLGVAFVAHVDPLPPVQR